MINRVIIKRMAKKINVFFSLFGNKEFKGTLINHYGLFTKPKKNDIGISLENNELIIPLTNSKNMSINLSDGDIAITNGKSHIWLKLGNDSIEIKTSSLKINCRSVDFKSTTLKHNGINIGATHTHISAVAGSPTTPPTP